MKGYYPFKYAFVYGLSLCMDACTKQNEYGFLSLNTAGKRSTAQCHGGMAQLNVGMPLNPQRLIIISLLAVNDIRHI